MFSLLRNPRVEANQRLVEGLYQEIVTAARRPAFYTDHGVADTFEGRFDLMVLLAALALRRLNRAEEPGPAVAQDLVDAIFSHLDSDMRAVGVGDLAVPKRIKKIAAAFLGRSAAYEAAASGGTEALAAAISRNIFDGRGDGLRLARYAQVCRARLSERTLDSCLREGWLFPLPEQVS